MATDTDAAPPQPKKASNPAGAGVPSDIADTAPTCYLLNKIPAEMRNTIYELVFTPNHNEDGTVDVCKTAPPSKALTMTCRQIHQEARGLYKSAYQDFWQENNFIMKPTSTLLNDLEALREEDLQHIQHVMLQYEQKREGYTVTHSMLSNAGAWKETLALAGTTFRSDFYFIYHESVAIDDYDVVRDEKTAMNHSARQQPKPRVRRQLNLHAEWVLWFGRW